MKRGIGVCGFGLCALFLAGCDSETREPELLDTVRAIKTFTVTEAASGNELVREFLRLAVELSPSYFLFENVKSCARVFITHHSSTFFSSLSKSLPLCTAWLCGEFSHCATLLTKSSLPSAST